MSKLLKSWKILSFGLLSVALGLMLASCAETDEGTTTGGYSVSIGTMEINIVTGDYDTLVGVSGVRGSGTYEKGETVSITAGTKSGYSFVGWTSDEVSNVFGGVDEDGDPVVISRPTTSFTMPEKNVRITAWYVKNDAPPTYEDGLAQVRFSWPDSARKAGYDIVLSASDTDVEYWLEEVYGSDEYVKDDATDFPKFDGNPLLPDNFYKSAQHATTSVNKSKYFDTEDGSFTAVCSVEDEYGIFDFVANYTITVNPATATADGDDVWFEVAFDIIDYIEYYNTPEGGPDDTGVFTDKYDNPNTDPRLEKAIVKKPVKTYKTKKVTSKGTIDITYYVLHRTRK